MNKLAMCVVVVAAVAGGCWAQQYQPVYQAVLAAEEQSAPARYAFEYSVHDEENKDIHSHKESRDGDKTEGEYSLVEPDGGVRTVKYHVDGNSGFIAEVIRSAQVQQAVAAAVASAAAAAPLPKQPPTVYLKPVAPATLHVAPATLYRPQFVVPTPAYVANRAFDARAFNNLPSAPAYNNLPSAPAYNTLPSAQAYNPLPSAGAAAPSASFAPRAGPVGPAPEEYITTTEPLLENSTDEPSRA